MPRWNILAKENDSLLLKMSPRVFLAKLRVQHDPNLRNSFDTQVPQNFSIVDLFVAKLYLTNSLSLQKEIILPTDPKDLSDAKL